MMPCSTLVSPWSCKSPSRQSIGKVLTQMPNSEFSSFIPLSKCHQLRKIDLSLMIARISLNAVFRSLRNLNHLSSLCFPRYTYFHNVADAELILWPPNLKHVTLSGIFSAPVHCYVQLVKRWPPSLQHVTLADLWALDSPRPAGNSNVLASLLYSLHSVHVSDRINLRCQNLLQTSPGVGFLRSSLLDKNATGGDNGCSIHPIMDRLEISTVHQLSLELLIRLLDRIMSFYSPYKYEVTTLSVVS